MTDTIGKKIKDLRVKYNMTLKDLSDKTELSTGYLSQLERGLTTVSVDSLVKLSEVFDVQLSHFFNIQSLSDSSVLRSYERTILSLEDGGFIQYQISSDLKDKVMIPRMIELLPQFVVEDVTDFQHHGEEFIYVLEGILTLSLSDKTYELFPGDTAHFKSETIHNWFNKTNKVVKILTLSTQNTIHD